MLLARADEGDRVGISAMVAVRYSFSRGPPVKAAILLALAGLSISIAQAAERAVLLVCEGKVTQPPSPKPESISVGIKRGLVDRSLLLNRWTGSVAVCRQETGRIDNMPLDCQTWIAP
jgi:hypothetical protein